MLTVWDDGRGMSRQHIVDKAIARGIIDSAERMTDQEVWQMIFLPIFHGRKGNRSFRGAAWEWMSCAGPLKRQAG